MLLSNLNLLATAPGGVAQLRELILTLAVQGKLVPQEPADEPASVLLQKIREEKDKLIAEGKVKKDKPLAEIAEKEKPFELPEKWAWIRLGSTMEMLNGRAFKPTDWIDRGLPIVRIQNLNNPHASFNYCDPSTVAEKNLIDDGAFLISWSGTPGTSFGAFIWNRGAAALNQHIFKCVLIGSAFLPEFLRLSINSQLNVLIAQAQGGVGLQHITKGVLENLVLVLPSLAEQSRIVTRVEELMRLCDALEAKGQLEAKQHAQLVSALLGTLTTSNTPEELVENWQRVAQHFDLLLDRPEAVDALEQTILQLAVRGLLVPQDPADEPASVLQQKVLAEKVRLIAEGKIKRDKLLPPITDEEKPFELPEMWTWARVADLCSLVTDGEHLTPPRCEDATQVPLVTAKNVRHEVMDYRVTDFVSQDIAEKCWKRCKPLVRDILMVSVGATLGRLCVLREPVDMVLVRSVTVLRPVHLGVFADYLALHLMSKDSQSEIWREVKQSAQPCLYLAKSAALKIALPPLAEQSRIVARVTELRRLCADLRLRLSAAQTTQSHLAQALVESATTV